jgi:putative transposase
MKKQFNARKSSEYPWMKEVHRDAHAQPFANLAKAWSRFFDEAIRGTSPAQEGAASTSKAAAIGIA